jgi:outer membrane lipopolysaccharide assembly protein LptE/RlpB
MKRASLCAALALSLGACGYHVAGHVNALPAGIQTIAIPAFANTTPQPRVADHITKEVTREMIQRTRYRVVADPGEADAVLTGAVTNVNSYPTTYDPTTGRASGVYVIVNMQIKLTDRNGKVLFNRPNFEVHERYEISVDPKTYFDESTGAVDRLSREAARSIVSGILEQF